MARYLHAVYRSTDPKRSRAFYEALGFESRRESFRLALEGGRCGASGGVRCRARP
jgi:catechol 2,3-dioxygenase-like lactoylglutathione lyase family enzyme